MIEFPAPASKQKQCMKHPTLERSKLSVLMMMNRKKKPNAGTLLVFFSIIKLQQSAAVSSGSFSCSSTFDISCCLQPANGIVLLLPDVDFLVIT